MLSFLSLCELRYQYYEFFQDCSVSLKKKKLEGKFIIFNFDFTDSLGTLEQK